MDNHSRTHRTSKVLATTGIALATLLAVLLPAAPASAAVKSTCTSTAGDLCIYWGQSFDGSKSGVDNSSVSNYPVSGSTGYIYVAAGMGQGQYLGNNNGSTRNYHRTCQQRLYYDPSFGGTFITLGRYLQSGYSKAGTEQGALLNNLRSHRRVNCT